MSMKDVAAGVTSVATVSKFENGVADLASGKVLQLLQNMGVSFRNFVHIQGDSSTHAALQQVMTMYRCHQIDQLQTFVTTRVNARAQRAASVDFNELMIAAGLCCDLSGEVFVTDQDIRKLAQDLRSVTEWDENEVYMFNTTVPLLPDNVLYELAHSLLEQLNEIHVLNASLYQKGWLAVLDAIEQLMERQSSYSTVLLRRSNEEDIPLTISVVVFRLRVLNLCEQERTQPTEETRKQITDMLDLLKFIEADGLVTKFERHVRHLVNM